MKTIVRTTFSPLGKKNLLVAFAGGIILSFFLYGFAIANITLAAAETKSHNNKIQILQTDIAELEVEYFDMINALSLEDAEKNGFFETPRLHYAKINDIKSVAYNI